MERRPREPAPHGTGRVYLSRHAFGSRDRRKSYGGVFLISAVIAGKTVLDTLEGREPSS